MAEKKKKQKEKERDPAHKVNKIQLRRPKLSAAKREEDRGNLGRRCFDSRKLWNSQPTPARNPWKRPAKMNQERDSPAAPLWLGKDPLLRSIIH
jgi:hypothetical protein